MNVCVLKEQYYFCKKEWLYQKSNLHVHKVARVWNRVTCQSKMYVAFEICLCSVHSVLHCDLNFHGRRMSLTLFLALIHKSVTNFALLHVCAKHKLDSKIACIFEWVASIIRLQMSKAVNLHNWLLLSFN